MGFKNRSRYLGISLATLSLIAGGLALTETAAADTIFTVNGADVDSGVVDLYFGSRLGNQDGQTTPEQREALMSELRDIYILATQDNAQALAQSEPIASQIDLQTRSIVAQAVATEIIQAIVITDEEVRAEYDEQLKLTPPLEFNARHILVETQGEAVEVINQLNDGADFQELAKEKSTGPSGPTGGDLGWFAPNQMVAPFATAVAAMEDGDYTSEPVQTQFGWHVIMREESRNSVPPTYEASQENMRVAVQQRKFQEHLEELRAAAASE